MSGRCVRARAGAAQNEALQQTRSAFTPIAAALAAERRCSTDTSVLSLGNGRPRPANNGGVPLNGTLGMADGVANRRTPEHSHTHSHQRGWMSRDKNGGPPQDDGPCGAGDGSHARCCVSSRLGAREASRGTHEWPRDSPPLTAFLPQGRRGHASGIRKRPA
jgi:hypothetical protein